MCSRNLNKLHYQLRDLPEQGAKLAVGHVPLYARGDDANARQFGSLHAVQRHMADTGRFKMAWEDNEDEYDEFYRWPEDEEASDVPDGNTLLQGCRWHMSCRLSTQHVRWRCLCISTMHQYLVHQHLVKTISDVAGGRSEVHSMRDGAPHMHQLQMRPFNVPACLSLSARQGWYTLLKDDLPCKACSRRSA